MRELAARNWHPQEQKQILMDDIVSGGINELGVLLTGHKKNAYWYGSQLSVDDARKLAPYNNATSLQVTAACLSGMIWAIENPSRGLVEPDEMDFRRNLEICMPYLGRVFGEYTNWNPLHDPHGSHPRTSTPRIPGSSRTSESSDRVISYPAPFVHPHVPAPL